MELNAPALESPLNPVDAGDASVLAESSTELTSTNHTSQSSEEAPEYLIYNGATGASADVPSLNQDQLTPVFQAALEAWRSMLNENSGGERSSRLDNIAVDIADLGGQTLGRAVGSNITIDADAAGIGWFVDSTPADDSEYLLDDVNKGRLVAVEESDADNRIDLYTVLLHEIGHVLGFGHDSDTAFMQEQISDSERLRLTDANFEDAREHHSDGQVISGTSPNLTLDLSASENNSKAISIRVNADGTLKVEGSATDDGSNIANVAKIIGNTNATIMTGPDQVNFGI